MLVWGRRRRQEDLNNLSEMEIIAKCLGECTEELKAQELGICSEGDTFDPGRDGAVVLIFKVGG